jgi:tetratricopeptide (TPR) repeat protein
MRGISNSSRLVWRDWRNAHRHHRHLTFIFYDPFWPYFAYSPFCSYYAAPITYGPWPLGYMWAPVYGNAAPYAEIAPSYSPPTNSREQAEPDELAAAKSGAEIYPFARQAEEAFRARDYKAATRAWRHAIVDDPNNGALLLRLAQALFAAGEYDEAAGATQQALMLLPEEKWQPELSNTTKLYANPQDYKDQLKGLERAVKENPDNPALRFELGFQYGFSGRRAEALRELDKLLQIAPQDQLGRRLKDLLAGKIAGEKGAAARAGQPDHTASIK